MENPPIAVMCLAKGLFSGQVLSEFEPGQQSCMNASVSEIGTRAEPVRTDEDAKRERNGGFLCHQPARNLQEYMYK